MEDPENATDDRGKAQYDKVRRPHHDLLYYYGLQSLLLGPFFLFLLVPRYVRYRTLRYTFDDEGVTMRWGALFRREISLTYGRIQDIHLSSNLVERWLGLARVLVQTAAGSAEAEMTIEGLPDATEIRDRLYQRMRGARHRGSGQPAPGASVSAAPAASSDELARALLATAAELRALRQDLAARRSAAPESEAAPAPESEAAPAAPESEVAPAAESEPEPVP